jgi:hypothetical protein
LIKVSLRSGRLYAWSGEISIPEGQSFIFKNLLGSKIGLGNILHPSSGIFNLLPLSPIFFTTKLAVFVCP